MVTRDGKLKIGINLEEYMIPVFKEQLTENKFDFDEPVPFIENTWFMSAYTTEERMTELAETIKRSTRLARAKENRRVN